MHSVLMRAQPTHTTTVLSTLRTLQHLGRLDKETRDRKGFRGKNGPLHRTFYPCFPLSWLFRIQLNRLPDPPSLANRPSTMKFLAAKTIESIRTVASDLKMGFVVDVSVDVGVVWMWFEMWVWRGSGGGGVDVCG